ncbi:MAG: aminotransferase class V-fold PLP-dependent enzyme [Balneolaceae bacterium]
MICQKHLFSLDENITYLNCAFMSPLMKTVEEAGVAGVLRKREPYLLSGDDFFTESKELRQEFAKLINAKDAQRIAIIPSVSYGLANVAKNLSLEPGDNIIVVGEQFPSNIYPWHEVAKKHSADIITVSAPSESHNRGELWNEAILNAIDSRTKLVALANIHWADGTIFNLPEIRERSKQVNALLVIDGTQSVGALPFDVDVVQPDALVVAGYKSLMGPYSIGLAYYGPAFDNGTPIEQNWINRYKSDDFANLVNYSDEYQPGALRYGVGEQSNFILVPMMLEALRVLNELKPINIQKYCSSIIENPINELRDAGFIIDSAKNRAANLFGIRLAKHHSMEAIKTSFTKNNIHVSYRGDAIRVSPNMYNDVADLEKLTHILLQSYS